MRQGQRHHGAARVAAVQDCAAALGQRADQALATELGPCCAAIAQLRRSKTLPTIPYRQLQFAAGQALE